MHYSVFAVHSLSQAGLALQWPVIAITTILIPPLCLKPEGGEDLMALRSVEENPLAGLE